MTKPLEFRVDKFVFRVAVDRAYTNEGIWVMQEELNFRIGLSDYLQQRSGDVAFVEVKPAGTLLARGDEIAVIETIKVDISLTAPVAGKVIQVNPALVTTPELINQDPYGEGWLAVIEPARTDAGQGDLLHALDFFIEKKQEAEQEVNKR